MLSYPFPNDITVYLGENARDNDKMLTTYGKLNNLWFHSKDYAGSHVIIAKHPNQPQPIEQHIIEYAATLAASHSKAPIGKVDVSMCDCIDVEKKRYSKNGEVCIQNQKIITVIKK